MRMEAEIRDEFLGRLKALFREYGASMCASDHYQGYSECGEDIKMMVEIPAVWSEGDPVREYVEIDLGSFFHANN